MNPNEIEANLQTVFIRCDAAYPLTGMQEWILLQVVE